VSGTTTAGARNDLIRRPHLHGVACEGTTVHGLLIYGVQDVEARVRLEHAAQLQVLVLGVSRLVIEQVQHARELHMKAGHLSESLFLV